MERDCLLHDLQDAYRRGRQFYLDVKTASSSVANVQNTVLKYSMLKNEMKETCTPLIRSSKGERKASVGLALQKKNSWTLDSILTHARNLRSSTRHLMALQHSFDQRAQPYLVNHFLVSAAQYRYFQAATSTQKFILEYGFHIVKKWSSDLQQFISVHIKRTNTYHLTVTKLVGRLNILIYFRKHIKRTRICE